jgi:hypothetical protein
MWTLVGSMSVAIVGLCAGGGVPAPGAGPGPRFRFDEFALAQALPVNVARVLVTAAPDETSARALPDAERAIAAMTREVVQEGATPAALAVTPARDKIVEICARQAVDAVARVQILTVRDREVVEMRIWDREGGLLAVLVGQPPPPPPDPVVAARALAARQETPAEDPARLRLRLEDERPSGLRRAVTITGGVLTVTGLVLTTAQVVGAAFSAPFKIASDVGCALTGDSGGLDSPSRSNCGSRDDGLSPVPMMLTVLGGGMWLGGAYMRF